ncbi:glycosyltransferase family 4 protein [Faecalicatena contorta]|uniref:Glycosyltransferase involved in cell wall bisynthesis n=1 Tax=Faecalicatena contorta TaxID=39482 RepID=A0A315ZPJ1_9FIRM|nr:glycosyltransferase family 4 protein [Faecalicatena contorta]PWJ47023.1 glycosyltransferase involved in cell wall biosynthesis [Faecalicatena contorta]SUQ16235.1 Glycosyltransferase involved in cell wall bisynthesis [Faecalicatena contorta]
MKILSVSAQKPDSTGSGIYLTELVRGFDKLGSMQAVSAGVYKEDLIGLPKCVQFYPVYYGTDELTFAIPGMSDEMPYESTVYREMTEYMVEKFRTTAMRQISKAVKEFEPDVILCHHLYLLTAWIREAFPNHKVAGICHGTDLRQMLKTDLRRDYIKRQIQKLDIVFALQEELKEKIKRVYGCCSKNIHVVGVGYNDQIFYMAEGKEEQKKEGRTELIFAGKLAEKKGVMSLIRSLEHLDYRESGLVLKLAGGYGNQREYEEICRLAALCKYPVHILGKLPQEELAAEFRRSDVFVLPSFYEGLPLVLVEALACGLKVVSTDLPGIRPWLNHHVPGNGISFVEPPRMENADDVPAEELSGFEQRLAASVMKAVNQDTAEVRLNHLSWESVSQCIWEKLCDL